MDQFHKLLFVLGAAMIASACNRQVGRAEANSATYGVNSCGGAPSTWSPHGSEYGELAIYNALAATNKGLTWNGTPLTTATAKDYLRTSSGRAPAINIQVIFDPEVSCLIVGKTRSLVSGSLRCGRNEKCVEYSRREYESETQRHAVY